MEMHCSICHDANESVESLHGKNVCDKLECVQTVLRSLQYCYHCNMLCSGFPTVVGDKQFCTNCSRAEAHVPFMTEAQKRFYYSRKHG